MSGPKKLKGCGDHGLAKHTDPDGKVVEIYDPWCLKCNPPGSKKPLATPAQKEALRLDAEAKQRAKERKKEEARARGRKI